MVILASVEKLSFYASLDDITALDPAKAKVVPDSSPRYRTARLWLESTLRKTPVPLGDRSLTVSAQALATPLSYQQSAVRRALDPENLRPRILLADAVGLGKTLEADGFTPSPVASATAAAAAPPPKVYAGWVNEADRRAADTMATIVPNASRGQRCSAASSKSSPRPCASRSAPGYLKPHDLSHPSPSPSPTPSTCCRYSAARPRPPPAS